ncbi:MAG: hypothetical protein J5725_13155 [Bacteroidales bacterium]|nr:hypothetical protein [Bacteroidales bacterium]
MIDTREIVLKLKQKRQEMNLSLNDIVDMTNGMVSKSTVQRVFAEDSENTSFRYNDTIRPLVKAMLDVEDFEDSDEMDTKALKSLLKLKIQRIEELEKQNEHLQTSLDKERIRGFEKFESERKLLHDRISFLTSQIEIKDKRMDEMKQQYNKKDEQYTELVNRLLNCHACSKGV